MLTSTLRLSIYSLLFLATVALVPFLVGAEERGGSNGVTVEAEADAEAGANYNNTRSNRSSITSPTETNVCDGVTCSDGSCAATRAECGLEDTVAPAADSVCNGYLCDSGECVTSEAMCGLVEEVEMAPVSDSVCNGYLCDSGECVTSEAMCSVMEDAVAPAADSVCSGYLCSDGECVSDEAFCGLDVGSLPGVPARCSAEANVRCGDGSCVASPNRCPVDQDRIDPDDDNDTVPTRDETDRNARMIPIEATSEDGDENRAQNHNSSRSNRTSGMANEDLDSDNDGVDDEVERAQDYNAARSNKPTRSVFSDNDTDGDGRAEVTQRSGGFIRIGGIEGERSTGSTEDGEVLCWGRAEDESGKLYAWGRGICVALEATSGASDTAQERLAALQVRGDEVRGWSEEEKTSWREYRETRATTSTEERLAERMVEETQNNGRIKDITSDDDGIEMSYRAEMRLLGLFPLEREVKARTSAEGRVEVDYPWYRFLSRVPEESTIQSTLRSLQALLPGRELDKASPKLAE